MIFRIGGLFILCVLGAVALSNVSPFTDIGYGAGLLLTTAVYVSLVTLSLRRRKKAPALKIKNLPPWPRQPWGIPIFGSATLMFLTAGLVKDSVLLPVLLSGGAILFGLGGLMVCKVAFQLGYFPSGASRLGPHRGVSREEDKLQFFATVLVYLAIAAGCFYGAFICIFQ